MLRTATLCALIGVLSASAQETSPADQAEAQDDRLTFGGLVQTQFNTTSADATDDTQLTLRRVRLGATAEVSPVLTGRIQAELAPAAVGGSAELNEAYVLFRPASAFGVLAGKGGRPFGIVDLTGAGDLVPIERGARFRGANPVAQYKVLEALAYAGRSVGVQVLGDLDGPLPVTYAAGYFTGALSEEGGDADIRQLAGRVTVAPIDGLALSVAATSRAFSASDPVGLGPDGALGADPTGETRRGAAFAVDAEVGSNGAPGFHAVAEVAVGTINPFTDARFRTAQGWVDYRIPLGGALLTAVQPLVRVSVADVDAPSALAPSDGVLLTPGVNLYGAQGTRLMLNLDVFYPSADGADVLSAFRAQAQVAF